MKFVSLVSFLIFGPALAAQQPTLIRYTIEDGLPSNEVYRILEDSHGYLWFSTDRGVSRFDGHTFENFTTNDGLMNNTVFSCTEDEKGRIWFSSFAPTLSYYEDGRIHPFEYNPNIRDLNLPITAKEELIIDNQILYSIAGLYSIKIEPDGKVTLLNDKTGFHISPLSRGHFVFTGREGEEHYRNGDPRMIKLQNGNTLYENITTPAHYRRLILEKQSIISTGTHLFRIRNNTISREAIFDHTIDCIALDSRGGLWLTFVEKGACRYDSSLTNWEPKMHLLAGKSVSYIVEDREGGFWIAVLGEGVYYAPSLYGVQYYAEKLPAKKVVDMCSAGNNRMFISFFDGDIWELSEDSARRVRFHPTPLRHGGFNPIHFDRSAGRLISMADLERVSIKNRYAIAQQLTELTGRIYIPDEVTLRNFTVIEPDPDGGIWIGSHTELTKFNTDSTAKLHLFSRSVDSIGPDKLNVDALLHDKSGMLWLGTMYGLVQYDKGRWIRKYKEHPLLTSRIDDMALYNDSTILMAGRGTGIIYVSGDTIFQISVASGLSNNLVNSITVDSAGTVWAGTNDGLNKITFKDRFNYSIKQYSTAHGLPSNYISKLYIEGNKVYVGTMAGLCVLIEDDMNPNQVTPVMKITGWEVNGTSFPVTDGHLLAYDQNSIHFDFIGITFNNSENVQYQYKLEGLEADWQITDNRNVRYNSLPYGPYLFMIKARNADGYWSEPVQLSFVIAPPFWEKWWFLSTAGLATLLISYLVIKRRDQAIAERAALKANYEKEAEALKLRALRAQMNPHFTFNTLNSIQNYVASNDIVSANRYLAKFARLIRNMLDSSQYSTITLEEELTTLREYLDLEKLRFKDKLRYSIIVENENELAEEPIPPTIFQPFVENAIIHGILPKDGEGHIDIRIKRISGHLECTIEDNGVGRRQKSTFRRESLGLRITKDRLDLVRRANAKGSFEIIDLKDNYGNSRGTKVVIQIPIDAK